MANKVKYGLKNCYYSVWTESTDTYATPVALPGAVKLSLSQQGGTSTFRADNTDYWTSVSNAGYSGSLELATIPDSFLTDVMGETLDANSVQYELATSQPKAFALLFEFEGDEKKTRHVLYNCKATRPGIDGATTEEGSLDPQTETIDIVAKARPADDLVKAKVEESSTSGSKYITWFTTVYVPTIS